MLTKLQRSKGSLDIGLFNNEIKSLFQSGSSKVLLPNSYNENKELVLINTTGGITCNDSLKIKINLENSNTSISTQAAEKIYAGIGEPAQVDIDIILKDTNLNWLPKELILFNNSKLKRRININIDNNSNFIFCETSILGRKAMSEKIQNMFFSDIWRVTKNSNLKHIEAININGKTNEVLNNRFTLNNHSSFSTILIFGKIVEKIQNDIRKTIDSIKDIFCELSIWDEKIVIRSIANDNYDLKKTLNYILKSIIHDKLPKNWNL